MRTSILFFMLALTCSANAQSVFLVQNDLNPSAHNSLDSAFHYAVDGDYIYLPGGTFTVGNLVINKRLHLVGAGHFPDSTQATGRTILVGDLVFITGADGSSVEGIYYTGDLKVGTTTGNGNAKNLSIRRCSFNTAYLATTQNINYGSENIFIKDCILRNSGSSLYGGKTPGVVVETSVIAGRIYYFEGNAEFRNNVFLYSVSSGSVRVLNYINNCNFKNNIFRQAETTVFASNSSNNVFHNNVFSMSACAAGWCYDCVFEAEFPSLFVNVPAGDFDYQFDFHLSETSAAAGAGIGGTDCGIFGGEEPFKEGAVPFNPHIQTKYIPGSTDSQGKLNIEIKVSAQEN